MKTKIPLKEGQYAGIIIQRIKFLTILRGDEFIQILDIIEMAFSDKEIIGKISRFLVYNRHYLSLYLMVLLFLNI